MRLVCVLLVALATLVGCRAGTPPNPQLAAAESGGALAVADALEALIAAGKDTARDRSFAYEQVSRMQEDSAAAAYGRALVTGRLVQLRGLRAALLVREVEREAERSRQLDPGFRQGAATRLLGSLYAMAPATLLAHGNSERGVTLLEEVVARYPAVVEHRLRLAEALLALGDPESAAPHLCRCLPSRNQLTAEDRRLLDRLVADNPEIKCPADPAVASGAGSTAPPAAR